MAAGPDNLDVLRVPIDRLDDAPRFWDLWARDTSNWGQSLFVYIADAEAQTMWQAVEAFCRATVPVTSGMTRLAERHSEGQEIAEATGVGSGAGQGFGSDAATNKAVEMHAMRWAEDHFAGEGYVVVDVSANHPYDLECKRDGGVLFVEVKGTQTSGEEVLLTRNEVEFARGHKDSMALFIVSGIEAGDDGGVSGGESCLILPWDVDEGTLRPYGYTYRLPGLSA